MLDRRRRRITVDQYFTEIGETEERFELVDGEVWQMAGSTRQVAQVGMRIFATLYAKLAGGPCEPFGSNMPVQLDATNFRYPNAAIYCDPRDTGPQAADQRVLYFPKVIFEVLSPSTAAFDRGGKIAEYKTVPSVMAIIHVDAVMRTIELHERAGPESWVQTGIADGAPLKLRDPAITLTAAEIFGKA